MPAAWGASGRRFKSFRPDQYWAFGLQNYHDELLWFEGE